MDVDEVEEPANNEPRRPTRMSMDVKDEGPAAQTASEASANANSNDMDTKEDKGPAEQETPEVSTNGSPGVAVPAQSANFSLNFPPPLVNFPVVPAFDTNHTFNFNPPTPNSQTGPSFNTNQPPFNFAPTRAAATRWMSTKPKSLLQI